MNLPNELLINMGLGVVGSILAILIAMTAYFLMRLVTQLDKTTGTVQELSSSFQKIAISFERYEEDNHQIDSDILLLKNDMHTIKKKLNLA